MNRTARRSRPEVARDLDGWLDAFDQTPVRPPTRQSVWIVVIAWVVIAVPLFWQAAQDVSAQERLRELAGPMLVTAAMSLTTVWQPAFRWTVVLRNKLASSNARRWGHRVRWTSLAVVALLAGEAIVREDWGGFLGWAMAQVVAASEAFAQFIWRRASLIDRVPVDSVHWARRSARLLQAHIACAFALWTWFLLASSTSNDVGDAWAILGVSLAVVLPTLARLNRLIREICQRRSNFDPLSPVEC